MALENANSFKELGALLDKHIDEMPTKTNGMLCFIQRQTSDFYNPSVVLCLIYSSLVRSIFKYSGTVCGIVWDLHGNE